MFNVLESLPFYSKGPFNRRPHPLHFFATGKQKDKSGGQQRNECQDEKVGPYREGVRLG